MEKKFSDEKAIELIYDALQKLKRGESSFEGFAVGVAMVVDPVPPTEKDFEWARETARLISVEAVEHPLAVDGAKRVPIQCPFHFYDTDGVHVVLVDRCSHPNRKEWRERPATKA